MPEFFRSIAKKPGATKVRKGYKKGGRIGKANGGFSHVAGYSPVLGNNKFGYPSGGVPVRTPIKGGGVARRGMGKAVAKGGRV